MLALLAILLLVLSQEDTAEAQDTTAPADYLHYVGALHEHSGYSDGWPGSSPADYYASAKSFGLDFLGSSEHSDNGDVPIVASEECASPNPPSECFFNGDSPEEALRKWEANAEQAEEATSDSFTGFRGFEWSSDRHGHLNVYFSRNFTNAKADGGDVDMDTFWR